MRYPIHARVAVVPLIALVLALVGGVRPLWAQCDVKLLPDDNAAGDYFGWSLAVDGDLAVIGAWGDGDAGSQSGSVYVYRRNGSWWVQEAKLTADDAAAYDTFGYSVDISGDVILVGSRYDDDKGPYSGSAYVFRYDGSGWVQEAKLLPDDGTDDDQFGFAVAIDGQIAMIGAPGNFYGDEDVGCAYVFEHDGVGWSQTDKLVADDAAPHKYFAFDLDLSGTTAVIGAWGDQVNGPWSGSAYVFGFDGMDWIQQAKLLPSDGAANQEFGRSVAIGGDTLLIGAQCDDENGRLSGAAYVFRRDGSSWMQEAKLLAGEGVEGDYFGASVAISDDTAVIGAVRYASIPVVGAAYAFGFDGVSWAQQQTMTGSDTVPEDGFGCAVAISARTVLGGAYHHEDDGDDSGSAYMFSLCPGDLDGDGFVNVTDFTLFAAAYGSQTGDADYRPLADIVCDGCVNVTDFTAFGAEYGTACP
jgi:hypothetical protein